VERQHPSNGPGHKYSSKHHHSAIHGEVPPKSTRNQRFSPFTAETASALIHDAPPAPMAAPQRTLSTRLSVRRHESEIVLGVLVVILCSDNIAGSCFLLGKRKISFIPCPGVLRPILHGTSGSRSPTFWTSSKGPRRSCLLPWAVPHSFILHNYRCPGRGFSGRYKRKGRPTPIGRKAFGHGSTHELVTQLNVEWVLLFYLFSAVLTNLRWRSMPQPNTPK
jgi:hypothetical protein